MIIYCIIGTLIAFTVVTVFIRFQHDPSAYPYVQMVKRHPMREAALFLLWCWVLWPIGILLIAYLYFQAYHNR